MLDSKELTACSTTKDVAGSAGGGDDTGSIEEDDCATISGYMLSLDCIV